MLSNELQPLFGFLVKLLLALTFFHPPHPAVQSIEKHTTVRESTGPWRKDPEISWYGPGFYGRRTACGLALTRGLVGVAHRSLPCGTRIEFRWKSKIVVMPVVDRGPYVNGRIFDLTGGACMALEHCFTGPIEWRIVK